MKIYFADNGLGLSLINASSKAEAVSKIKWDYANCGDVKLVIKTYKLLGIEKFVIPTNY